MRRKSYTLTIYLGPSDLITHSTFTIVMDSTSTDPWYIPSFWKTVLSGWQLETTPTWSLDRGRSEVKVNIKWDKVLDEETG